MAGRLARLVPGAVVVHTEAKIRGVRWDMAVPSDDDWLPEPALKCCSSSGFVDVARHLADCHVSVTETIRRPALSVWLPAASSMAYE